MILPFLIFVLNLGLVSGFNFAAAEPSLQNPLQKELAGKVCAVWEDPQNIPHLHVSPTEKTPELQGMACIGLIHGLQRSWQMDYLRRTAQGRNAEILGKDSIKSDFFMRLIGLDEKAKDLFQQMTSDQQNILWAYSWGVNQGFKAALAQGVYEFREFDYEPEPWVPTDTLAMMLLQSFDQTRRSFQIQFDEMDWAKNDPIHASELFNPEGTPWDTTLLKAGEYSKNTGPSPGPTSVFAPPGVLPSPGVSPESRLRKPSPFFVSPTPSPSPEPAPQASENPFHVGDSAGNGSNSWVVSPQKSRTGHAWLANDPHLKLTRPAFWHWIHLEAGMIDAIGATLPGVPVFISGTNRHLSWGVTNSFLPVARVSYVPTSDLAEAETFRPRIWVRVWKTKLPFIFKSFKRTKTHLPILPVDAPDGKAVVLRWTGLELLSHEVMSLFQLASSKSVFEADRVFSKIGVPSWNFVFADDLGNIGYRAIGRTPRFEQDPLFGIPVESLSHFESSSSFEKPLLPDEMPHFINPARGYIVTANQRQWPSDSQFSSGKAHVVGYRAFRIEELIQKKLHLDLLDHQRIQCDVQVVDARFITPKLLEVLESREIRKLWVDFDLKAIRALRNWDFEANLKCKVCALYRRWVEIIYSDLKLNSTALFRKISGKVDLEFKKSVLKAFHQALDDVQFVSAQELKSWGTIHQNAFHHLSGEKNFSLSPISTPGDEHTVNPGTSKWTGTGFDHTTGASQRMIVEMSKPPKVYAVQPGSNLDLENPDLSHPHSEWQEWARCELKQRVYPVDWNQAQVKKRLRQWTL